MKHILFTLAVAAVAATWAAACGPFQGLRGRIAERRAAQHPAAGFCSQTQAPAPATVTVPTPAVQQAGVTHGTTYRGDWSAPPPPATEYQPIRLTSPLPTCVGPNCPK